MKQSEILIQMKKNMLSEYIGYTIYNRMFSKTFFNCVMLEPYNPDSLFVCCNTKIHSKINELY